MQRLVHSKADVKYLHISEPGKLAPSVPQSLASNHAYEVVPRDSKDHLSLRQWIVKRLIAEV